MSRSHHRRPPRRPRSRSAEPSLFTEVDRALAQDHPLELLARASEYLVGWMIGLLPQGAHALAGLGGRDGD